MGSQTASTPDATIIVARDVGTFTWNVLEDRLKGDGETAAFFGLPREEVAEGLSVHRYLDRIIAEDRDRTASAIHEALVAGGPYHAEYRVAHENGDIVHLTAVGRCFFDSGGVPVDYCGVIFKKAEQELCDDNDIVKRFCHAAYERATESSRTKVATMLEPVLTELGLPISSRAN